MLTRVLSVVVALPLFFLVFFFAPRWVVPFALGLISAEGTFELLYATHFMPNKKILTLACVLSFCVTPWIYFLHENSEVAGIFLFICVLFFSAIIDSKHITFEKIAGAFFAAFVIPYFLSSIMRILMMGNGEYLMILPFIAAWITDTFAYFTGRLFGKHKLAPVISPKKTVEGAVGGIIASVIVMLLYGVFVQFVFSKQIDYFYLFIMGVLGSIAAQLGDLSMSVIKRNYSIKDYGTIMPGHGGALDRFDSVLFAAPLIETLLYIIPPVIK